MLAKQICGAELVGHYGRKIGSECDLFFWNFAPLATRNGFVNFFDPTLCRTRKNSGEKSENCKVSVSPLGLIDLINGT